MSSASCISRLSCSILLLKTINFNFPQQLHIYFFVGAIPFSWSTSIIGPKRMFFTNQIYFEIKHFRFDRTVTISWALMCLRHWYWRERHVCHTFFLKYKTIKHFIWWMLAPGNVLVLIDFLFVILYFLNSVTIFDREFHV